MSSSHTEILNDGGLRQDGRRPYDLRAVSISLSPHPSADGSATVQQGLTTVTATVYGPREPRQRQPQGGGVSLVVEVGMAGWAGQGGKRGRGDKKMLEVAAAIKQTFEPVIVATHYQKSEISIFIQVLGADGGILPTAINATTLALITAGISLLDYLVSLSIGLHLTQPLVDLSSSEESDIPFLVLASTPSTGKITLATLETRIHVDRVEEMLRVGVEGCRVLKEEMEGKVKERTERMVKRMGLRVVGGGERGILDGDEDME